MKKYVPEVKAIVYIAGPYRSLKGAYGILENIMKAKKVAERYWKKGMIPICPHMNSALMDGVVSDRVFLEGDIQILRRCDKIVLMQGWEKSIGVAGELREAKKLGLEIIYDTGVDQ
jgi:hypothetical protein